MTYCWGTGQNENSAVGCCLNLMIRTHSKFPRIMAKACVSLAGGGVGVLYSPPTGFPITETQREHSLPHTHSFRVTSGFFGKYYSQVFPCLCPLQSPSQTLVSLCEAQT